MTVIAPAVRRFTVRLTFLLAASAIASAAHAQGGPGSHTVVLPNPTPRPDDPHDLFRDDPVAKARQQQTQALIRTQMHAQVVLDANNILLLAKQIHDRRTSSDPATTTTGSDLVDAQKVEKLAKRVKENSKIQ